MITEKTGKLINDRTQIAGVALVDILVLFPSWFVCAKVFIKDQPIVTLAIFSTIYVGLVALRASKRKGWIGEVVEFYGIREGMKGAYSVERVNQN